jgi:hypothetical protein
MSERIKAERMTERHLDALESHNSDDGVDAAGVDDLIAEVRRAHTSEAEKDEEIERLKADNMAVVGVLREYHHAERATQTEDALTVGEYQHVLERVETVIAAPHPGAALLEEMKKKDEALKSLADALERTGDKLGGDWHSWSCRRVRPQTGVCLDECKERRAALRLVGRVP